MAGIWLHVGTSGVCGQNIKSSASVKQFGRPWLFSQRLILSTNMVYNLTCVFDVQPSRVAQVNASIFILFLFFRCFSLQ